MDKIVKDFKNFSIEESEDYLNSLNQIMGFQGNLGRIKDNIESLVKIYKLESNPKKALEKFSKLYEERNLVMHGIKLPIKVIDNKLYIAKPKGTSQSKSDWTRYMNWSQYDINNAIQL